MDPPDSFFPEDVDGGDYFGFGYGTQFSESQEYGNFYTDETQLMGLVPDDTPAVPAHATTPAPAVTVPLVSGSANDGTTPQQPEQNDWETHRTTIESMYQKVTLKSVVQTMLNDHGFSASKNQYRKQMKKWNTRKNLAKDEMHLIVQIRNWHKREGRDTEFVVRGLPLHPKRISRFIRENPNTPSVDSLPATPDWLRWYTHHPDSQSTSGGERYLHGSSSALHGTFSASQALTVASSLDSYLPSGTIKNTTAPVGRNEIDRTSRVAHTLTPSDLADISYFRSPVDETDLQRCISEILQLAAERRAQACAEAPCHICGFRYDSKLVYSESTISILISTQTDLNMTNRSLIELLCLAIKHKQDTVLRHLVSRCRQPTFAQRIHRHLLCMALQENRGELFRWLLLHGIDADGGSASGSLLVQARMTLRELITAHVRWYNGIPNTAEAIGFMYRARVITPELWGKTLMWVALRHRRPDILRACLRPPTSAVLDIDMLMNKSAKIRKIIKDTESYDAAAVLVNIAAEFGVVSENGADALHLAASFLLGSEVQRVLVTNPDANKAMKTGETALHTLAGMSSDGIDVARILLSRGASATAKDSIGDSVLHKVARHPGGSWKKDLVELLLQAGADINALNHRGETPLITAALTGATAAMEWFHDHGARRDAVDFDGNSAEMYTQDHDQGHRMVLWRRSVGLEEPWNAEALDLEQGRESALRAFVQDQLQFSRM